MNSYVVGQVLGTAVHVPGAQGGLPLNIKKPKNRPDLEEIINIWPNGGTMGRNT